MPKICCPVEIRSFARDGAVYVTLLRQRRDRPLLIAVVSSWLARPEIAERCREFVEQGDRLYVVCNGELTNSLCLMERAGIDVPLIVGEEITGFDILIGYEHGTGGRDANDI